MSDGSPGWMTTVAADFAARGEIDDALVRAATAAQVGLATVDDDGRVWWSDETYRLHGRPRWRRVRTIDDLAWGPREPDAVRAAYIATLEDPDVELRYTAVGEAGETRDLVLHALGRGVAVVHRAVARSAAAPRPVVDVRDRNDVAPAGPAGFVPAAPLAADAHAAPPPTVEPAVTEPAAVERALTELSRTARDGVEGPTGSTVASDTDAQRTDVIAGFDIESGRWGLASAVLAATPDLLMLYDLASGRVVSMAGNAEESGDIVEHLRAGGHLRELVHPDDMPALVAWGRTWDDLVEGEVSHIDARMRSGEDWRWRELRAAEFRRADDHVVEIVVVLRDVHDRVASTLRVAESERAFREVFEVTPVGLAVLDENSRFTDVNDAFCRLVGRTREAVLSTVYEALLHPQDRAAAVITRARRLTEGTRQSSGDARIVRADGSTVWVRVRSTDIDHHDGGRTLLSIEDVTHAKATEDQLRHDAMHDELTGLPNRRLLLDRLERALSRSRRGGTRLAVFFIDLDDLKRVNDTHPWKHRAGDVLITTTAAAMRDALRDADTLGRLGGDEFVAICEDMGDDTVDDIGQRILRAAVATQTIGGETIRPGASIGVALTGDDEEDAETLLRRADAAMYRAKRDGGSRVVRADADGSAVAPPFDVVGALDRRELVQHYQPIVSLSTGAVLGMTTVVRWRGEGDRLTGRPDTPDGAARTVPVVQWSLAQAVADVRTVAPTRVEHVSVWVPTSARAALASSTRDAMRAALQGPDGREGGNSAPSLVLDVDESEVATLARRHGSTQHLDELLDTGPLALGVARFTADSIPLGVLQQLSAASVSLDPGLLAEAAHTPATAEVVHALVAAASALGVVTVAMHVDTQEQLETARALGVHAVFGDLVGPPAPLDTYSDLLHGGRITLPQPPTLALDEEPVIEDVDDDPDTASDAPRVDEWARNMAARLAEPAAEKNSGAEPAHQPTAVSESPAPQAPPQPVEAPAPSAAVQPAVVDVSVAGTLPTAEPAAPETQEADPVIAPAEPTVPAAAAEGPDATALPLWLRTPAPPIPPAKIPGDIGAELARELGISWPLDPLVPGAFAPVSDEESPHWQALSGGGTAPSDDDPTGPA